MTLLNEFEWRGLIYDKTDGVEEHLENNKVTAYIGFDPSAASLHVGSLLPIMALARLQRFGHIPIAIAGGGTGLIGDPSGKTKERLLLTKEQVDENLQGIKSQLELFLDFESETNPARIINNAEWLSSILMIDFLRDVGKYFTVNYLLAKESTKRRIEQEDGISFTEFSYTLLQAYDFLILYDRHKCTLQMGGSDQWGNIVAGIDLIRRLRSSSLLEVDDLHDVASLLNKLQDNSTPLSVYLLSKMETDTVELIRQHVPQIQPQELLIKTLVDAFNNLLRIRPLYQKEAFEKIQLRPETKRLLAKNEIHGEESFRLNRMLLEDAFSDEIEKSQKAYGMVFPLVTTTSGVKFGKTEAGTIWLDAKLTSPYRFYQFWFSTTDQDVVQYLKFFTWLSQEEIAELEISLKNHPEKREAQKKLAQEVTKMVHGVTELKKAEKASAILFGEEISGVNAGDILDIFGDVPSNEMNRSEIVGESMSILSLLIVSGLATSKGDARRLVEGGGIYINNNRVTDTKQPITSQNIIEDKFVILRKGQKQYHLVKILD